MKAYVLHDIGDLRLENVPKPQLSLGEVLVAVKAVGICGSDIPRIYKTGAHRHPLIPGHEFSGVVVEAVGHATQVWLGKRVGVFPLLPCRACEMCNARRYEMCERYGYIGSRQDGAFAEYTAVPAGNLVELPDAVSFEEGAMLEPMAVAVHALRSVSLSASDSVAVYGLGTIGMLVAMLLRERGVSRIFFVANKDLQKCNITAMGFPPDAVCDIRTQRVSEWMEEKTEGKGVDVAFECVGRGETIEQATDNAAAGGRIVFVGNPASDIALRQAVYWKILRRQLRLNGVWNSSFLHDADDDWSYALERMRDGRVRPARAISHLLSFAEMEAGLRIMRDKMEDYGKIMVEMR